MKVFLLVALVPTVLIVPRYILGKSEFMTNELRVGNCSKANGLDLLHVEIVRKRRFPLIRRYEVVSYAIVNFIYQIIQIHKNKIHISNLNIDNYFYEKSFGIIGILPSRYKDADSQ